MHLKFVSGLRLRSEDWNSDEYQGGVRGVGDLSNGYFVGCYNLTM